ncbi:MOSC N-terminal beta barrel domain-containing protein [Mesobacterium sp. TK19101]|uniref:MOSC N-terminal beta barrel domain-containing protein n=1 Tax=Mesobacterium hydrothermale TaxID=3111907 RepID=A0ABU6HG35_9RHOB|nr:MOSC N-terminal beta barrel domain-containing protein [Mesobacterium sp. TK19101]MEC3861423.1 MOSC N-terminal beta barrel domain-containing protein [Mesobacterium sp. TK19101]
MTARVTQIWRHPIKSHGRESLDRVALTAGQTVPWDRVWAVALENSDADGSEWVSCGHFSRVSKAPALMAITARLDPDSETIVLSHPDRDDLTIQPDRDGAALLDWVAGLVPENRAQPARLIRARAQAMTDSDFPSVTLCNMSSHRAVEQKMGRPLSVLRWRGNIWMDGLAPWEEFEWMGREVQIGSTIFKVRERTDRCTATTVNPDTGVRDADTLSVLDTWGHRDFSVRAEVVRSGEVAIGDGVHLL